MGAGSCAGSETYKFIGAGAKKSEKKMALCFFNVFISKLAKERKLIILSLLGL